MSESKMTQQASEVSPETKLYIEERIRTIPQVSTEAKLYIEQRLGEAQRIARDDSARARNQAIGVLGFIALLVAILGGTGIMGMVRKYSSEAAEKAVSEQVGSTYVESAKKAVTDAERLVMEASAFQRRALDDASTTLRVAASVREKLGEATTPVLENGWTHYKADIEGEYNAPAYFKDASGLVHLKGMVMGGQGTIFTLPNGYRPARRELHAAQTYPSTIGRVDVLPDGQVVMRKGSPKWISLDGITFRAGPICRENLMPITMEGKVTETVRDEEQIRMLVRAEGATAEKEDIAGHASLFDQGAVIESGYEDPSLGKRRKWTGCLQIVERDAELFGSINFEQIKHENLTIDVLGERRATATSDYKGIIAGETSDGKIKRNTETGKEKWEFRKGEDLIWRISRLSYE